MTIRRYDADFYTREDTHRSITPNWKRQPDIGAPHGVGDWQPAHWLPITFTQYDIGQGQDAYVISSGKVVALDSENYVVPAGYRGKLAAATTDVVLTYTMEDVKWKVTDFTTGETLTAPKTVTALAFAKAAVDRGLVDGIRDGSGDPVEPTTNSHVETIVQQLISLPVGVVAYDVHVYAGAPERGDQRLHNYSKQARIQFLTEQEAQVPHMAGDTLVDDEFAAVETITFTTPTSGARPEDLQVLDATGMKALGRYNEDDVGDVVLLVLSTRNVAADTARTPIVSDIASILVSKKGDLRDVTAAGDFYLDAAAGYLIIHRDVWDTLQADETDPTISYYAYSDAALSASEKFIYFNGTVDYGSRLLSVDAASNFCQKGSDADILASTAPELGQVLAFDIQPKNLLPYVKTAFEIDGMSARGRMPGSATAGLSDNITLASEKVADTLAILKIRI